MFRHGESAVMFLRWIYHAAFEIHNVIALRKEKNINHTLFLVLQIGVEAVNRTREPESHTNDRALHD